MSKSKRARQARDNAIGDLQEWQNHQYNPGYLSNLGRLRLFSGGGRRTKARTLLVGVSALFGLLLLFIVLTAAGISYTLVAGLIALAMIGVLIATLARLAYVRGPRSR